MANLLNKTSLKFLVQFAIILSISFSIIFAVGYYSQLEETLPDVEAIQAEEK